MKTVAVDAMGGDNAPQVEVEGAVEAARSGQVRVVLVGDETRLRGELQRLGARNLLGLSVRHATEVITMHDPPSAAVRRKKDSSMRVAVERVRDGAADAVVSAGNSGAMMACSLFVLKRLPGVDRPAILTTFPTRTGNAALLDMGANVECRPLHLVQFAVMGATFARQVHNKRRPRVGLLSNGAEDHKGTELTRETHRLLRGGPAEFEYVGYVEGRDVFSGRVDVVVCDGFSGNLVLKVTEGVAETLASFLRDAINASLLGRAAAVALLPTFKRVKRRMDYAEQGGAPLLGVCGSCIICHGGSNAKAIKNAILGAGRSAADDLAGAIGASMDSHAELVDASRGRRPGCSGLAEAVGGCRPQAADQGTQPETAS